MKKHKNSGSHFFQTMSELTIKCRRSTGRYPEAVTANRAFISFDGLDLIWQSIRRFRGMDYEEARQEDLALYRMTRNLKKKKKKKSAC